MAYSYEHNPTNADAVPLYNDSIFKIWNWFDDNWSCNDWVTWHKANDKKYGRTKANEKFLHYWDDLALVTTTADCRNVNVSFRNYMHSVGITDDMLGASVFGKVIGTGADVVDNVTKGVSNTSKVLRIILPLVLIVFTVFAIIYVTKGMKSLKK